MCEGGLIVTGSECESMVSTIRHQLVGPKIFDRRSHRTHVTGTGQIQGMCSKGGSIANPTRRVVDRDSRAPIVSQFEVATLLLAFAAVLALSVLVGLPFSGATLLSLNLTALAITFYRSGRTPFTPTIVLSSIITLFGVLGYFVYPLIQDYGRTPGHDPSFLVVGDESVRMTAFLWFMIASVFIMVGSWTTSGVSRSDRTVNVLPAALHQIEKSNVPVWFALASIAFNLLIRDPTEIISRDSYQIQTEVGGVATYLQLPAAFMLGMIYLRRGIHTKTLVLALSLLMVALSFALSSRMLSLTVLMLFTGLAVSARRYRWIPISVGALAALALIPIPIYMRGLGEQGLIPNFEALPSVALFTEESYWSTAGNLLSAFNVVAITGSSAEIPWDALVLSILPLPGVLLGNQTAGADLRINFAIPYAGLGEVASQGIVFLVVFFVLLGLVVGWVERKTDLLRDLTGPTAETLVPLAVAALTAFLFVQYNLRTAMRFEYVLLLCGVYVSIRYAILVKRHKPVLASVNQT